MLVSGSDQKKSSSPAARYSAFSYRHISTIRGQLRRSAAGNAAAVRLVTPEMGYAEVNPAIEQRPFLPLVYLFMKDAMDRVGAATALILFSPLFMILALKIKSDGGPAFYGHVRIGKNGRSFKCWKFRSMVMNSQEILQDVLSKDPAAREEYEKNFKLKNDPRITKVGNFLRKTSLDEISQLFNVLCGEMSLVGPRPVVEAERKYYGDKMRYYTSVKPGITGLWQVSGRSDTGYDQRVYLDCFYVKNWSLWNDIVIIFKTIHVVLARKGAY